MSVETLLRADDPEVGQHLDAMTEELQLAFERNHPNHDKTVFLMMRFGPHPLRNRMHRLVKEIGADLGFDVLRADDHDYSGELWRNVKLCMDNCARAIAVFDAASGDGENLSVELGYLFAKEVPCLILRDVNLGSPPAMLTHRLHAPLDPLDLEGTLVTRVGAWLSGQVATS